MLHFHSRHICILSITLWLEKGVHIKLEFKSYYFHFLWFIKLRESPIFRRNGVGGAGAYRSTNYGWKERAGRTEQYSDKLDRNKPVNGHASSLDHSSSLPHHRTSKKRRKSRSSDSGSGSSRSGSGSRSSSSSSSRSSSSGSNSSKSRSPSRASVTSKMKSSLGNYLPHTEFDKQCTIILRNLPHRTEGTISRWLRCKQACKHFQR